YKTFQRPYLIKMDTDAIVPGGSKVAQLTSTAYIYNPSNLQVHTDSLRFSIFVDGNFYGSGAKTEGFTLKANDTSKISIPFTFDLGKFFEEFEKTQKDSGLHLIKGKLYVDILSFNSVEIPFSYEENMPV